ncbi:hypothetical protein SSP35_03_00050 [Streptomyces sp. NBRC 110611]|uniref:hypothetical protein n=1 Tax=Streptomyces sp. NBRC 110611 TaxID=1621259 RepID=UPI000858D270|nr:hypothetical protein [Streptomyces sp. NBRC 110611]GAU66358.1 hypothetical protein SSP35_03_00050 [Streptomyces sp. NBRC 110611]
MLATWSGDVEDDDDDGDGDGGEDFDGDGGDGGEVFDDFEDAAFTKVLLAVSTRPGAAAIRRPADGAAPAPGAAPPGKHSTVP